MRRIRRGTHNFGRTADGCSSVPAAGAGPYRSPGRSAAVTARSVPTARPRWPLPLRPASRATAAPAATRPPSPLAQSTSSWRTCAAWASSWTPLGSSPPGGAWPSVVRSVVRNLPRSVESNWL